MDGELMLTFQNVTSSAVTLKASKEPTTDLVT
jgi:hypothetical protein